MNQNHEVLLCTLELTQCPDGMIFDAENPNKAVDAYFQGWYNPLGSSHGRPSLLEVCHDASGGLIRHTIGMCAPGVHRTVRDHYMASLPGQNYHRYDLDRYLISGSRTLRDYTVRARVSLDSYLCSQSADNSVFVRAMSGVFARFRDGRHYYFLCLEGIGNGRLALYKRDDDTWTLLGHAPMHIGTGVYYALALRVCASRLTGFLNGQAVIFAQDEQYKSGGYGFRFSTAGKVRDFSVAATEGQARYNAQSQKQYLEELESRQAQFPKMRLLQKLDLRAYMPFQFSVVTLPDQSGKGFLVSAKDRTALVDLSGKICWETPVCGYFPVKTEPEDGSFDIDGVVDAKLTRLDGATGALVRQRSFSEKYSKRLNPDYRFSGWPETAVNLRGTKTARDILVRDCFSPAGAGSGLWAYDEDLNLLWHADDVYPLYGHLYAFAFWDMTGDGREDVFAGCSRYSPDGRLVWSAQDHYDMANFHDALHIDANVIGNFSQDPQLDPILFCAVGSAGVYAVDAKTGKTISNYRVGHAQAIYCGHYLPGQRTPSVISATRWNDYGILTLFNGRGERVDTFQPDYISEGGPAVNWNGSGQELMLIVSGTDQMGLYDYRGDRMVCFPEEVVSALNVPTSRYQQQIFAVPLWRDSRDEIVVNLDGILHIYTQDDDLTKNAFAPRRRLRMSY